MSDCEIGDLSYVESRPDFLTPFEVWSIRNFMSHMEFFKSHSRREHMLLEVYFLRLCDLLSQEEPDLAEVRELAVNYLKGVQTEKDVWGRLEENHKQFMAKLEGYWDADGQRRDAQPVP